MDVARDAYLIEQLDRLAPSDPFRLSVEAMQAELIAMRAENAERDAPAWLPLKLAAYRAEARYDKARGWAADAIKAGRVNEARKVGGRVVVNINALLAHRVLLTGK
jgi:hypothetical protein